jgi:hypothetical protein
MDNININRQIKYYETSKMCTTPKKWKQKSAIEIYLNK